MSEVCEEQDDPLLEDWLGLEMSRSLREGSQGFLEEYVLEISGNE